MPVFNEEFKANGEVAKKEVIVQQSSTIDLIIYTNKTFIDTYLESIEEPGDTFDRQWREYTWDKKSLDVRDPATIAELLCLISCPFCLNYPSSANMCI